MRLAFHTTTVSPHQLPFARELAKRIGADNYRYIFTRELSAERQSLGWRTDGACGVTLLKDGSDEARAWLEEANVLLTSFREPDLIERRCARGLRTFYMNERWFKPIGFCAFLPAALCAASGRLRLLLPGFRRLTKRLVSLSRDNAAFRLLPIGVHAFEDYAWAGAPRDRMDVWGYFVSPSAAKGEGSSTNQTIKRSDNSLRVLWVGRFLALKRVDTLIRAVRRLAAEGVAIQLTLVGEGPEKKRLMKLAGCASPVVFAPAVALDEVRRLMRMHDVYVLASSAYEGWGAVVSEALEEGMNVIGSREAGATATLLPADHLFPCGDVAALARLLRAAAEGKLALDESVRRNFQAKWTAAGAAERFLRLLKVES